MTSSAQDTALPSLGKVRPISHKSRKRYVTDRILWQKVKTSVISLGTKMGVKRDTAQAWARSRRVSGMTPA